MKRLGTQSGIVLLLVGLLLSIILMLEEGQAAKAQQETPTPADWSSPTLLSPSDDIVTGVNAISFVWSDESASGAVGYTLRINGVPYTVTKPYSFTVLSDGVYTWTVRALDNLGNASLYSEGWNLTVDSTILAQTPSEPGSKGTAGQGVSVIMATVVGGAIGLWIVLQVIRGWRSGSGWAMSVWSWLMQLRPAMAEETNMWHRIPAIGVSVLVAVVVVLGTFLLTYGLVRLAYTQDWTGFNDHINLDGKAERAKTLWDWMQLLIIPIVFAVGGYWYNQNRDQTEREIAKDRLRDDAYHKYLDSMTVLLREEDLRKLASRTDEKGVRDIAQARTLAILRQLDGMRKGMLIQFLHKADLIVGKAVVDLEEADLSDTILGGADLTKINLLGANLRGADLSGAELREATLTRADLREVQLSEAKLFRADLSEATLSNAIMLGARLDGATLFTTRLGEADLTGAFLEQANLDGAIFRRADLSRADLTSTQLNGADLRSATLVGAILNEAKLLNAKLSEANLSGASLISADLSGADLSGVSPRRNRLVQATLHVAKVLNAKQSRANPNSANLREVTLVSAKLRNATLREVDLRKARLSDAILQGADLTGADLRMADLRRADLRDVKLNAAFLQGADLCDADLTGATLSRANLTQAILTGAIVSYSQLEQAQPLKNTTLPNGTKLSGSPHHLSSS